MFSKRIVAEIDLDDGSASTVHIWHTLSEMRGALADAAERYGPLSARVYRWPGGEYDVIDTPTWYAIRPATEQIGVEHYPNN